MSALGDVVRRRTTAQDLLRTVINEILELKNARAGPGKTTPKANFIANSDTAYISHAEPTITTTTSAQATWDSATADYEFNEYA